MTTETEDQAWIDQGFAKLAFEQHLQMQPFTLVPNDVLWVTFSAQIPDRVRQVIGDGLSAFCRRFREVHDKPIWVLLMPEGVSPRHLDAKQREQLRQMLNKEAENAQQGTEADGNPGPNS